MKRYLMRASLLAALLFATSTTIGCAVYTHPRRGHTVRYVHDHGRHEGHPGRHDNGHHYGQHKDHGHGHGHGHDHDDD